MRVQNSSPAMGRGGAHMFLLVLPPGVLQILTVDIRAKSHHTSSKGGEKKTFYGIPEHAAILNNACPQVKLFYQSLICSGFMSKGKYPTSAHPASCKGGRKLRSTGKIHSPGVQSHFKTRKHHRMLPLPTTPYHHFTKGLLSSASYPPFNKINLQDILMGGRHN